MPSLFFLWAPPLFPQYFFLIFITEKNKLIVDHHFFFKHSFIYFHPFTHTLCVSLLHVNTHIYKLSLIYTYKCHKLNSKRNKKKLMKLLWSQLQKHIYYPHIARFVSDSMPYHTVHRDALRCFTFMSFYCVISVVIIIYRY